MPLGYGYLHVMNRRAGKAPRRVPRVFDDVSERVRALRALRLLHPAARQAACDTVALTGRCARRNERIWRTASGTRSFGSFQGKKLTSAFGASIAHSIATA